MPDFTPTPRQRTLLDRLAIPHKHLIHQGPAERGLYFMNDDLGSFYQSRTVRPLIEAGLIPPAKIRRVQP